MVLLFNSSIKKIETNLSIVMQEVCMVNSYVLTQVECGLPARYDRVKWGYLEII